MENRTFAPIQDRYRLEVQLLRLKQQLARSEEALRQAKFDLREAKVAQLEYGGSFRSFRDRLSGKKEETETALRHGVQKAETALAAAQREKEEVSARLAELEAQLATLPAWEACNDGSREWHRLEALYCAEAVTPLLEANRALLVNRRNQFNGTNAGQLKSRQDLADIYSAPEAAGEACKIWLLRLKEALDALEIPLELHRYFLEPTVFLSSATQYTRMDRINEAIGQVEKLQRKVTEFRKQLEESL